MQFLRQSTLGLTAALLTTLLFSFGLTFGLFKVFGTPGPIKSALKESGFYSSVVGDALKQATQEAPAEPGQGDIPVDRPEVQNIIKSAASPELLQAQTERALDSVYAWAQGKTPTLAFSVEMGDFKARLADGLAAHVSERVATLPPCAPGDPQISDFDPFNAGCLPPGADANQIAAKSKEEILNGEFLKDSTLTADNLKNDNGQTISEQLKTVPEAYRWLIWTMYGTAILALLMALAVVFLSANKRSGLKKVAGVAIAVGLVVAFLGWAAGFGMDKAVAEIAQSELQESALKAAQFLTKDLRFWWMAYGIGLTVLGVGILVALHFTKPKLPPAAAQPTDLPETQPSTAATEPTPQSTAKPKPKPAKRLVQ